MSCLCVVSAAQRASATLEKCTMALTQWGKIDCLSDWQQLSVGGWEITGLSHLWPPSSRSGGSHHHHQMGPESVALPRPVSVFTNTRSVVLFFTLHLDNTQKPVGGDCFGGRERERDWTAGCWNSKAFFFLFFFLGRCLRYTDCIDATVSIALLTGSDVKLDSLLTRMLLCSLYTGSMAFSFVSVNPLRTSEQNIALHCIPWMLVAFSPLCDSVARQHVSRISNVK